MYNKYVVRPNIKSLYLKGIQRNFDRILSEKEVYERNVVTYNFISTGWFEQIMNEELKEYIESLFNLCETQKQRDYIYDSINILLRFEEKVKNIGIQPEKDKGHDVTDL